MEIVAKGRDMKASKARKLADGRIYTAKQALANGLIDEIGTFEEAAAGMKAEYKLGDCELEYFESPTTIGLDFPARICRRRHCRTCRHRCSER